jgi:hypothetical protein
VAVVSTALDDLALQKLDYSFNGANHLPIVFLLLVFLPLAASAVRYLCLADGRGNWQTADRSSAGLLPPASSRPDALIRVFAARTVMAQHFRGPHLDRGKGKGRDKLQSARLHGLG